MQRSQYILVGIAALLALSVFTLALFSFFRPLEGQDVQIVNTPTPTSTAIPSVKYNVDATDRMLEIVNNRTAFSSADTAIRNSLVQRAESQQYLYSSENVRVEYLSSPDQFIGEILTNQIDVAKNEAVAFFSEEGLSADAICHLPLVFYLNLEARRSLPENTEFNPLPDNC